jgi:hypothetical protein
LGDGYSGLHHVRVCISFEDMDSGATPENAIKELENTPSRLVREPITVCSGDLLRKHLIEFLSVAPGAVKSRFLKQSEKAMQHKKAQPENLPYIASVAGVPYKVCFWAGSPPSIDEWWNTVLHCSERLRNNFVTERIERVTFVAIPNTEQDYGVDAEFILPQAPKVYRERSKLRFQSPLAKTTKGALSFEVGGPERKLSEAERATLHKFDELDTRERLLLWNKHLSKFFG